jgi:hypothetical protein
MMLIMGILNCQEISPSSQALKPALPCIGADAKSFLVLKQDTPRLLADLQYACMIISFSDAL